MTDNQKYTVGWICAITTEFVAARSFLDEEHDKSQLVVATNDSNSYALGRISHHNVVIAVMPDGQYGTTTAATVGRSMMHSFPNVRIGLMVGIGGGAPSSRRDIRLGDVVVNRTAGGLGGVLQYDYGAAVQAKGFQNTSFLNQSSEVLRTAVADLRGTYEMKGHKLQQSVERALENIKKRSKYTRPSSESDRLYLSHILHHADKSGGISRTYGVKDPGCDLTCGTDASVLVQRQERDEEEDDPAIHYGLIASGNSLIKDAEVRDQLADNHDVLCFEMEAAGLMNNFPCLVIRGICDYSDSHKNNEWQGFAAMMAAAYAKDLLQQISQNKVEAERPIVETLDNIKQGIEDVYQGVRTLKDSHESIKSDQQTQNVRRWLSPPDPSTNANHARKLRHKGTGKWLLVHPVFQSWKAGTRQHVWLRGFSGCGKTVLSTTVLDHLEDCQDRLLLRFFFDFKDPSKQTVDGMLQSLAFQLYPTTAASVIHLDALYRTHDGRSQPTTEALLDVVCKMLATHKRVAIVLDALDESTERGDLLSSIKAITSRPESKHIQLICTSRPENEFQRDLPQLIGEESCLTLDKQAVDRDIRLYVAAQLEQCRDFKDKNLSQGLLEHIQSKVGDGAGGMFRWAFCQLDTLARCRHQTAMEEALMSLPRNLNETYSRMLQCIPADLKDDAIRLLQFLVHSQRPLLLAEAVEIIATRIEGELAGFSVKRRLFRKTEVLDYCPGLVRIVHDDVDWLYLSHFSVKEYLLGIDQVKRPTASISLTMTCLTYLTDIEGSQNEIKRQFPMARFAAEMWTGFAASAETDANVLEASVRFLQEDETFQRWCQLYQRDKSWTDNFGPPEGSRLYYACLAGLSEVARVLLDEGEDVNAQGGDYGNALQAASCEGNAEIVKLLLEKGADFNAQGGHFGNALQAASCEGNAEIVKLLLEKGADVNAQGGYFGNALQAAAYQGHLEIMQILLESDADINAQGGYDGNALTAAISSSHYELAKLLLERGADHRAQSDLWGNPLQAASANGCIELMELFLELGADVNATGGHYDSALQAAAFFQQVEAVKFLVEKGADVHKKQGGQFKNAVEAASWGGEDRKNGETANFLREAMARMAHIE